MDLEDINTLQMTHTYIHVPFRIMQRQNRRPRNTKYHGEIISEVMTVANLTVNMAVVVKAFCVSVCVCVYVYCVCMYIVYDCV